MNKRKNVFRFGCVALGLLCLSPLLLGGCTTARIPVAGLEVPMLDIPLPAVLRVENDLRGRSWSKAFRILHERLVREYAYGDHKNIDWASLYDTTAAQVLAAEEEDNKEGWYRALRAYVRSIPDSNVHIDLNDVLRDADVGASAGLALVQLADDSVIVCGLLEDGPAAAADIAWGATVFAWDGKPVAEALADANVLWAESTAGTPDVLHRQQLAWLTRGPEGTTHSITYMNPGDAKQVTVALVLAVDDYETLPMARPLWEPLDLFDSPVKTRVVAGGYRYIRIAAIAPTFSTPFPAREFNAAIRLGANEEAPGLILDLRGTQGGDSSLVPKMLGALVAEEAFFETPAVWDSELEIYLVESEDTVYIEPEAFAFLGPVVVLVDAYTMGPAESLAGFLKGRENVRVFGETGTCASPGVPDTDLTIPGGYSVMYPTRRSLDESGAIQGVSDGTGAGGVEPDTVFALDRSNASAMYQDGKDVLLDKAIELLD